MNERHSSPAPEDESAVDTGGRWRWLVAILLLAALTLTGWLARDSLSLDNLVRYEHEARAWQRQRPALAAASALALYVGVTGFSLPAASTLSVAYGWLFGWVTGVAIVSFGSTAGATLAMLTARYLLRDAVERRLGARWRDTLRKFESDGATYLLTLRLIPLAPFFLVNLLAGITRMRVWTFWWVSQLGMLPATCVYVWAGASAPSLAELAEQGLGGLVRWQFLAALALLAVLPLSLRWLAGRLGMLANTS